LPSSPSPQVLQRFVDRHPVQPRLKPRTAVVFPDAPERLEECLLGDICGILLAHHPQGQTVNPLPTMFIELALRGPVTLLACNYGFGQRVVRARFFTHIFRCTGEAVSSQS
jgi:hypothetical protein